MTVQMSSQLHSLVGMFCWKIIISSKRIFLNFREYFRIMAARMYIMKLKQLLSSAMYVSNSLSPIFTENWRRSRQVTHLKYIWQKSMPYFQKCWSSSGSTLFIISFMRPKDFSMPGHELVQLSSIRSKILHRHQYESAQTFQKASSLTSPSFSGTSKLSYLICTQSLKQTTMKGVTISLMPWTQPLDGCLMCHTQRILRIIFWTVSLRKRFVYGRVRNTSSFISLQIFFYWASCSRVGFSMQVYTIEWQSFRFLFNENWILS